MIPCGACGGEACCQAVLAKASFRLRFDPIPPGAQRGLFYCEACAEQLLASQGLAATA